jgi:hypothetical protein
MLDIIPASTKAMLGCTWAKLHVGQSPDPSQAYLSCCSYLEFPWGKAAPPACPAGWLATGPAAPLGAHRRALGTRADWGLGAAGCWVLGL